MSQFVIRGSHAALLLLSIYIEDQVLNRQVHERLGLSESLRLALVVGL